jgi:hypothetical protein
VLCELDGVAVRGGPESRHAPLDATRAVLLGCGAAVLPKAFHTLLGEQVLRLRVEVMHSASFHPKYLEIELLER